MKKLKFSKIKSQLRAGKVSLVLDFSITFAYFVDREAHFKDYFLTGKYKLLIDFKGLLTWRWGTPGR